MRTAGESIDRYVVEGLLGTGGMGAVYRAHDPRLDRPVAVKVVHVAKAATDASVVEAKARLLREARAAAKLHHPNAIAIYDVGEIGDEAFIAMELVEGKTLRDLLEAGTLSKEEKRRILVEVARALAAAHKAGVVHRDVKPENVMVAFDGGGVKVLDFGIARRSARELDPNGPTETGGLLTLTEAGVAIGTPLYMAPEQVKSEPVDGRTDQFAWGVVAWEAFAGKVPWTNKRDAMALAGAILLQPAPPHSKVASEIDPRLEAVVARALSKSPSDRFTSMDELIAALDRSSSSPIEPPPPPKRVAPSRPPPSSSSFRKYSSETARAILGRAIDRQAEVDRGGDGYEADELLAAAREVGVDDATLAAAEADVARRRVLADPSALRKRNLHALIRHAVVFAVVGLFFLIQTGGVATMWIMFGWGIGLAAHAARVFFPDPEAAAKQLDKLRKKRANEARKRKIDPDEVDRGLDALYATAAARRLRVEPIAPSARIATDVDRRRAEEEADAEAADDRRAARAKR